MLDIFSAVPSFRRLAINVLDIEKLDEWLQSNTDDAGQPPRITKVFLAYEKGPGTPVPVQIEVDKIDTEYHLNRPTDEESTSLSIFEYADKWRRVNMLLRRNLLLAVVRNLDPDDANILATDPDGEGYRILVQLGYLDERIPIADQTETETEEEATDDKGEVQEVDGTGELTLSISQPSTQE